MAYQASKESLDQHEVPAWFHDAKLGIFIHWGLYSVPAYAPTEYGDINETFKRGARFHFAHNPYAEWYLNSLKFDGGPYQAYHHRTYGEGFSYDDFVPQFNAEIRRWDPQKMANIFAQVGARYVVLTTKHHDGFLLWPSATPNPTKQDYHAARDIVGELTQAVKDSGLRMGVYYSGALDWSFNPEPIEGIVSMLDNGPVDPAYAEYADAHFTELVDTYAPSILWNDIGYPVDGESERIMAHFYNTVPEGVVNDRWTTTAKWFRKLIRHFPINRLVDWLAQRYIAKNGMGAEMQPNAHYDFRTPEYATYSEIREEKWECCRGLGRSFGYNRMETDEDHISVTDLIHSFVDIVSKNGNLLLNVGPMADGTIPELQLQRLRGLGVWLDTNGEAIFGTRPWTRAEGTTTDGIPVRFTQKGDALYAILLGKPATASVTINDLSLKDNAQVHLVGHPAPLDWEQHGTGVAFSLPEEIAETCAVSLRILQ